jgi:hypothetical protein
VTDQITFHEGSGPELIAKWAEQYPDHALFLDPPWGGRAWDRDDMDWSTLFGAYPDLVSAIQGARLSILKLPRTFQTQSLKPLGGTWSFDLAISSWSDHPADRVRFILGTRTN